MDPEKFYADGVRFTCTQCSACCRHDPGFVFLSRKDADALAENLALGFDEFVALYCRWIPYGDSREALCLKERSNYDCILWRDGGCAAYAARPLQCRTFPFWDSVMVSKKAWDAVSEGCPGMNSGAFHGADEIEAQIELRDEDTPVTRKA